MNYFDRFKTFDDVVNHLVDELVTKEVREGFKIKYRTDKKDDGSYVVELAVPGYTKKDIKISVENSYLKFKTTIEEEKGWLKKFEKDFYVSQNYDTGSIKAKLESGVLQVVIPLKEESKPQDITID